MNKKMKNISLMCISLFSSLVFAGNPIEIKSNQDLNSINFSNIKTIIQEIKSFDKKDEFTKQSVIDEKYKSYITKEFYFKQEECHNWGSSKYDINNEVYNIDVPYYTTDLPLSVKENQKPKLFSIINVSCSRLTDKTIGTNVFGVKTEISNFYETSFGIVPLNINPHKQISFNLKLNPNDAKNLKENIGFFYKVEIVNSIFKKKIAEDFRSSDATIEKPTSLTNSLSYLVVNLKEVSIYNNKTNKILMTKKIN